MDCISEPNMKTLNTLLFAAILSLSLHQGANAQLGVNPSGATNTFLSHINTESIVDFSVRQDQAKNYLDWTVSANSETSLLEIERSSDGKNFSLAAIVFPTENKGADKYKYYEKVKNSKTFYRVKIILKNGSIAYSPVLLTGAE